MLEVVGGIGVFMQVNRSCKLLVVLVFEFLSLSFLKPGKLLLVMVECVSNHFFVHEVLFVLLHCVHSVQLVHLADPEVF